MKIRRLIGGIALSVVLAALVGAAVLARQDRPLDDTVGAGLPDIPERWPEAHPPAELGFSVLRTGESSASPEAIVVGGGSWFTLRRPVHSAVLIRHPQGTLLFDTGLGRHVAEQFAANGALDRALFGYSAEVPAADQLASKGIVPGAIVLSHMHWDHASGLPDFPDIDVWVPPTEREHAARGGPPKFIASQFAEVKRWRDMSFESGPYMGFAASRDWFGDGSVVLVPMPGHTAGHVGLFLNLASGRRYLFSGDTTWTIEGVIWAADRSWLTRSLTHIDHSVPDNQRAIAQLHRLMARHKELAIVPAHDENVALTLPEFPAFSR